MAQVDGLRDALRDDLAARAESFGRETIELWVELTNQHLLSATPPATASQDEWNMEPIAESVEIRQRRGEGGQFAPGWVAVWTAETDDGIPLMDLFEWGTEPHDIEGNPTLHWTDPGTGEDVFRAKVRHPGIPAVAAVRFGKRRIEVEIEEGQVEA